MSALPLKPVHFVASSKKDLMALPEEICDEFGHQIYLVQMGEPATSAKALTGDKAFRGGKVIEIIEDSDGNTYRCVYTAKIGECVYILHVFQKKSNTGKETPKHEIETIKERYKSALMDYADRYKLRGAG